jgi:hypothetical protein
MRHIFAFLLLSAWLGACTEWHSQKEFNPRDLVGHTVRHAQSYDFEGAKRIAGAFLAQVARGGQGPFHPWYTACVNPSDAHKQFQFIANTFIPGWIYDGAELAVEIRGGPRLLFCLDKVVVNVSRFPCFECPPKDRVSVAAINAMRSQCGEAPYQATRPVDSYPGEEDEVQRLLACHAR